MSDFQLTVGLAKEIERAVKRIGAGGRELHWLVSGNNLAEALKTYYGTHKLVKIDPGEPTIWKTITIQPMIHTLIHSLKVESKVDIDGEVLGMFRLGLFENFEGPTDVDLVKIDSPNELGLPTNASREQIKLAATEFGLEPCPYNATIALLSDALTSGEKFSGEVVTNPVCKPTGTLKAFQLFSETEVISLMLVFDESEDLMFMPMIFQKPRT